MDPVRTLAEFTRWELDGLGQGIGRVPIPGRSTHGETPQQLEQGEPLRGKHSNFVPSAMCLAFSARAVPWMRGQCI